MDPLLVWALARAGLGTALLSPGQYSALIGQLDITLDSDWLRPRPDWARAGVCRHWPASDWSHAASDRRRPTELLDKFHCTSII